MKTAVMTDTNSGISAAEGKELGIYVLPMPVIIDEVSYLEGVNVTHAQLYDAMRAKKDFSSSQPSPASVTDLWDQAFADGYDEVVYLPMSSGLSGSLQSAKQYALDYDGKVEVVDNHRISVTLASSVFDAIAMAKAGSSAKEIREALEKQAYESSIYIAVNSLDNLRRTGRVTAAGAVLATALNLKPVLTIQGEKLDAFAKVRGMKQAQTRMIEAVRDDIQKRFANVPANKLSVCGAGTFETEEMKDTWMKLIEEAFPDHPHNYRPLSCSIACHVGINAIGVGVSVMHY